MSTENMDEMSDCSEKLAMKPQDERVSARRAYYNKLRAKTRDHLRTQLWQETANPRRKRDSVDAPPPSLNRDEAREKTTLLIKQYAERAASFIPDPFRLWDLDNDMHPIFKWIQAGDKTLKNIKPALRLASLLMTVPIGMIPYHIMANADVGQDENGPYFKKVEGSRRDDCIAWTRAIFDHMGRKLTCTWVFADQDWYENKEEPGVRATCKWCPSFYPKGDEFGRKGVRKDEVEVMQGGQLVKKEVYQGYARILIRDDYNDYWEKHFEHDTPYGQLVNMLSLTVLICHELSHALWKVLYHDSPEPRRSSLMHESSFFELGFLHELHFLGHWFEASRTQEHKYRGNQLMWSTPYTRVCKKDGAIMFGDPRNGAKILSGASAQGWFLKSTWKRIKNEGNGFVQSSMKRARVSVVQPRIFTNLITLQLLLDDQVLDTRPIMPFSNAEFDFNHVPAKAIWHALKEPARHTIPVAERPETKSAKREAQKDKV